MSMFYSLEDVRGDEFYQLPKDLIKNKKYKDLSANAKIAYAILKDRHQVSVKNQWFDEIGVYFLLSDNELAEILDTSLRSAGRYKNDLQSFGLIHMERQGLNRRNKIYLLKPEFVVLEKKQPEPLILADRTKLSTPDRTKLSTQDRTKMSTYSNNNLSNNDFSNKEEEEDKLSQLKVLFSNYISPVNKMVETRMTFWLENLPFEVIKAEIENAALYGAKSWNYVEKTLQEDKDKNINSAEGIESKVFAFKSNKTKTKYTSKKPVRKEMIPKWFDEEEVKHVEENNDTAILEKKRKLEERLNKYKKPVEENNDPVFLEKKRELEEKIKNL